MQPVYSSHLAVKQLFVNFNLQNALKQKCIIVDLWIQNCKEMFKCLHFLIKSTFPRLM